MSYSTLYITDELLQEIKDALQGLGYGSIEIFVQNNAVTQITVRNIKKVSSSSLDAAIHRSAKRLKGVSRTTVSVDRSQEVTFHQSNHSSILGSSIRKVRGNKSTLVKS